MTAVLTKNPGSCISKRQVSQRFSCHSQKGYLIWVHGEDIGLFSALLVFFLLFFFLYITESETTPYKASETKDIFYDVIKVIVEVPDQLPMYRLLLGLTTFE